MRYHLLLIVGALFIPVPAIAFCNVPQPRLVCAEYFASNLVVEATLVKVNSVRDKKDPEAIVAFVYSLRANRTFRGQIARVFRVYEGNDSGRATFNWKIGQQYLLFLFYLESEKSWALDGCGNSGPVEKSRAIIDQIDAIKKRSNREGTIHGVVSEDALSTPIAGILVEVRGENLVYKATTNANGAFEIEVPAGRYSVQAIAAGSSFGAADFSYQKPSDFRIEPGGCAQVQLARKHPE